ncbi:DUF421 domain-containing protein [Bacillus sp. Marseille-P3661]|uniref:DUF421 domain-containing protein n=1 Tax=Bacillus sp. Marseille-P3661 TaxID=1936234 RepID=UPI000C8633B6|nr:DUF421 domain-containing protein [Bacillus sp. Marseille-P3661]
MEVLTIVLRTLFLYMLIILIFRIMGKREIGELSLLDLVVFMMIAEMAAIAIEDPSKPLVLTIIPMTILCSIQILLAFISLKSEKFRDVIDGKPSILIDQGEIDKQEMKKQRYNMDDLLVQLREKDIRSVADVEFAILEPSGKLSVFEKSKYNTINHVYNVPLPLIKDGIIQEDQLQRMNKTNLWLRQELRKLGYKDVKKIMYCSMNDDGTLFVNLKNE